MKNRKFNSLLTKLISSIILLTLTSVSLAFVTVGSVADNDCDYHNLEDAYNDADVYVRATTSPAFSDDFTISKSKWFTGGYDTCADANANVKGLSKTRWIGFSTRTVVRINTGTTSSIVTLDGFEISDGKDISFEGAGGIRVEGNVAFLLANSEVHDNEGNEGGGIFIKGADARVVASNSLIYNNTATANGGGVLCVDSGRFTLMGDSAIKLNTADSDGGGIYASSNCQVTINSGDAQPNPLIVQYGVIRNTAAGKGGGIYITSGADVALTGNNDHPASIVANTANESSVLLGGGGVYIIGDGNVPGDGTTFIGKNARIDLNKAKKAGAGIVAAGNSSFKMERLESQCWDNDKCSSLSQNIVSGATGAAAAGYIYDIATVNISGTFISENSANNAALFVLNRAGTLRLEGNLIVGNTSNGQPSASELFVLENAGGFASNIDFYYNTIGTNNAYTHFNIQGTSSEHWVRVHNSIIHDQGDIFVTSGAIDPYLVVGCNYLHETTTATNEAQTALDNYTQNPGFVDAANGDYHVLPGSFSKDMCDENTIQSAYKDLNGNTRGLDDPQVPNLRGPFDAGAYENYDSDIIFKNGFE